MFVARVTFISRLVTTGKQTKTLIILLPLFYCNNLLFVTLLLQQLVVRPCFWKSLMDFPFFFLGFGRTHSWRLWSRCHVSWCTPWNLVTPALRSVDVNSPTFIFQEVYVKPINFLTMQHVVVSFSWWSSRETGREAIKLVPCCRTHICFQSLCAKNSEVEGFSIYLDHLDLGVLSFQQINCFSFCSCCCLVFCCRSVLKGQKLKKILLIVFFFQNQSKLHFKIMKFAFDRHEDKNIFSERNDWIPHDFCRR